jgi:transposase
MKKQIRRKISDNFKRMVVKEVISGKLTKESARRNYGIKGKSAVADWVRFYGDETEIIPKNTATLEVMTAQEREHLEMLKRKIAALEAQLSDEMHRAGLYKTMIEIAEEQLNIPIRKKYGAKQSKTTKSATKK